MYLIVKRILSNHIFVLRSHPSQVRNNGEVGIFVTVNGLNSEFPITEQLDAEMRCTSKISIDSCSVTHNKDLGVAIDYPRFNQTWRDLDDSVSAYLTSNRVEDNEAGNIQIIDVDESGDT